VRRVAGTFFTAAFFGAAFLGAAFLAVRMMGVELMARSAREEEAVTEAVGFSVEVEVEGAGVAEGAAAGVVMGTTGTGWREAFGSFS